jgi:hypothetical protein
MSAYDTINTKPPHYSKGFFEVGSGPTKVLILGSCRVTPYLNYFHQLNGDNRFTLRLINVVNFYFTEQDAPTDPAKALEAFETNPALLEVIKSTDVFIHEHAENFGMLNTEWQCPKSIYQFGMKAAHDLAIPNFNDIHLMFQEYVDYDPAIRQRARDDISTYGDLSTELRSEIKARGLFRLHHFLDMCRLSSFPDFAGEFEDNWTTTRYFWTGAHISNEFTMPVFKRIAERIGLETPGEFWNKVVQEDPYKEPHVRTTRYDVEAYGLKWPQPIEKLQI